MSSPGSRAVAPPPDPGLLSLYDEALPQVYGYLLVRCGHRAVAEDLTAETFLAAVRAESDGGGPTTVAWLIGTARHKLVDPWDVQLDALRAQQVLDGLSVQHRAVLTLRYLDDLPVPRVAALLGRTVHATEALLVRARSAFRRLYVTTGGSDD